MAEAEAAATVVTSMNDPSNVVILTCVVATATVLVVNTLLSGGFFDFSIKIKKKKNKKKKGKKKVDSDSDSDSDDDSSDSENEGWKKKGKNNKLKKGFKLLKSVGVTSTTISLKLAAFLCYAAGAFERLRAQDTFEISVDAFIIASAIFLASLFVPPRMLTVKYDNVQWVVVGGLSFLGAKYQTASRAFKELQQVPAECSGGQADAEKAVTMFIVTLLAVCSVATLCLRLAINGIVYDIADKAFSGEKEEDNENGSSAIQFVKVAAAFKNFQIRLSKWFKVPVTDISSTKILRLMQKYGTNLTKAAKSELGGGTKLTSMALSPKKTKKPDDKAMKVALRFLMEDKPERFKVTKKQMKKMFRAVGDAYLRRVIMQVVIAGASGVLAKYLKAPVVDLVTSKTPISACSTASIAAVLPWIDEELISNALFGLVVVLVSSFATDSCLAAYDRFVGDDASPKATKADNKAAEKNMLKGLLAEASKTK